MENFRHPLETVQLISIYSYLNILNDILFADNYLSRQDQHKQIPIVNSLYHYLQDNVNDENTSNVRKTELVRRILNGSDLYGSKSNETPDLHFVNTLLTYIVKSLVFQKYGNIYGFIAETVRGSSNESLVSLTNNLKSSLLRMEFENESNDPSKLDESTVDSIFNDLLLPLFPFVQNDTSILSVDFIYSQAGRSFLAEPKICTQGKIENSNIGSLEQEYIQLAHAVEQLVLGNLLNKTALKIFSLPALIFHVYKEKTKLEFPDIVNIATKTDFWGTIYGNLFSYLNQTFLEAEKLKQDASYQFYVSMSNYRNRTKLAREILENNCPLLKENEIVAKVQEYKNKPEKYHCSNGSSLADLNERYEQIVNNVTARYYNYEVEICREAFGGLSKEQNPVVISKGVFKKYFYVTIGFNESHTELIKPTDDFFEFYYPENETFLYFALLRSGYRVTLLEVTERPNLLRRRLIGRLGRLRNSIFSKELKTRNETFDSFLTKLATGKANAFRENLRLSGYDRTRLEMWKDFGLSLIPFYTCVNSVKEGRKLSASIACPIDTLLLIPVVGTAMNVGGKMATSVSKSLISLSHTTFSTLALRTTMRSTLKVSGSLLAKQVTEFIALFELKTFHSLGLSVARLLDPGFEFVYLIGKGGFRSVENFIRLLEERTSNSFDKVVELLKYTQNGFGSKQVGVWSGRSVFVNTFTGGEELSGQGYKYILLSDHNTADLRKLSDLEPEVPVVFKGGKDDGKLYKRVNPAGEEFGEEFVIQDEWLVGRGTDLETWGIDTVDGNLEKVGKVLRKLVTNQELLKTATEYASRLPEGDVIKELKKYAFPSESGRTELNFVREWLDHPELRTPKWAEQYKIPEADTFFELKYKEWLDTPDLTMKEATERLTNLYSPTNYQKLYQELPIDRILHDFKAQGAYKQVSLEDYFALRNYGSSGYRKMSDDCPEARRMKKAIYRLAIRQSEEPGEIFAERLYRGEGRIPEAIEKELSDVGGNFEFTRFTSTSSDPGTAVRYSKVGPSGSTQVLYDMKFEEPILRARVEDFFVLNEKETILLPGTKFHIDNVQKWSEVTESGVRQDFIKVAMTCVEGKLPKIERQRRLLEEIRKLSNTDFSSKV